MKSKEKRIDKLKQVLDRLSRRKTVQNRQLKTVLGAEGYARYCYDYREQEQLREILANKPKVITEYERRLKAVNVGLSKKFKFNPQFSGLRFSLVNQYLTIDYKSPYFFRIFST